MGGTITPKLSGPPHTAGSVVTEVLPYNHINRFDRDGYIACLMEQGNAHDEKLSKAFAAVVANNISREAKVNIAVERAINKGKTDSRVVGMSTLTRIAAADGSKSKIEDIIVLEEMRRREFGTRLLRIILIDSWNLGASGITWDMARDNEPAEHLYRKIDPTFNAKDPHDLWCLSPEQMVSATNAAIIPGRLATMDDLDRMDMVLNGQPKNISYLAKLLMKQEGDADHGESTAKRFIAITDEGSFAMISASYSTFQARRRADAEMHLRNGYTGKEVAALIKTASAEILGRHEWKGSLLQVRFADSMAGFDQEKIAREKERIKPALFALKESGCVPLMHGDSQMVGCEVSGDRYVKAVICATHHSPDRPLSSDGQKRLQEAAAHYSLTLGNGCNGVAA